MASEVSPSPVGSAGVSATVSIVSNASDVSEAVFAFLFDSGDFEYCCVPISTALGDGAADSVSVVLGALAVGRDWGIDWSGGAAKPTLAMCWIVDF